ncbi:MULTISPECIES: ribose-phosphate pyrophosphokinase [unclassified Nocardia]|uniref:ribose-phosphate diphosphokinase n=1 Tax=unclassified Nocardia TaxID=2637762 RepID=UPI001CE4A8AE|nr:MULTISPECIES: ribose-phosphate pyrophosphokinase [unclassified Nocardia]
MNSLHIVSGSANPQLAAAIADRLEAGPVAGALERFPDGELCPVVEHVGGGDIFVIQPTSPPVNDHLVELLLLLDACRSARAARITAVVPYFSYARQDRRTGAGRALGARVVAEAIAGAGADRLVVVDPHTPALEAICPCPVDVLTAAPILSAAAGIPRSERAVIVAPDLGAAELAERYASRRPGAVALVRKFRESGSTVKALEMIGQVEHRPVVIVDDMIATGATIEAAVHTLHYHATDIVVAATHGPLLPAATARLRHLPVRRVLVTDTVAQQDSAAPMEVYSVAPLLADAIARLHNDQPVGLPLTTA